jgi:hypothetical protein
MPVVDVRVILENCRSHYRFFAAAAAAAAVYTPMKIKSKFRVREVRDAKNGPVEA